ncbi:MAG: hypothetical protein ACPG4E_03680 [Flavobacteriaceae bacterium]
MPNTLGLHIGITSIGWALMDNDSKSLYASLIILNDYSLNDCNQHNCIFQ